MANIKRISEEEIPKYIEQRLEKLSWSDIYFEMKKEVDAVLENIQPTDLFSTQHNYTPIFMYYAIQAKCSIEEFSKILQISSNYEYGINRFFGDADCNYNEKENSHIYNKMNYLFYKMENGKISIDESKIKYIHEIVKNVREQNLYDFHSSRIYLFLGELISNSEKNGREIINLISNTPNMWKEESPKYSSLPMNLIKIFASLSYEQDVSKEYKILIENSDFYKTLKNNLIKFDRGNKYEVNLSIYKLISENEQKYFNIFMYRVQELKTQLGPKDYSKLIEDSLFSIKEGVKTKPFNLNLEDINVEKSITDNIPYLAALQEMIKNGQYQFIKGNNTKLKNYLENYKDKLEKDDLNINKMEYEDYSLISRIEFNVIQKFLQYQELDGKFEMKENKTKKPKI